MELFDRARGPPLYHLTFPVLESLNIYHARRMNSPSHNTLAFSRLVNFPSLKSLSLDGVAPEGTLEAPVLQHLFMDGQERLELDFTFGEFLKTCISLQTLELDDFGAWNFSAFMGPITLPNLVALTLKGASKKYVTGIASFLRLPRLDSLRFTSRRASL
ncbi:hypothetical protein DL93DRAFT_2076272 [Clavulina sp. PMI_390]|nr:hypothetical protein DL93DRAFT_2076272 [Clavulina sp. PMI_390]